MAGMFEIEFVNFAVFVHRGQHLTVVFGKRGHELEVRVNGSRWVHNGFADLTLTGTPALQPTATLRPKRHLLPDLTQALGATPAISTDYLTGAATQEQNGRLHLTGGTLQELPSRGDRSGTTILSQLEWDYTNVRLVGGTKHAAGPIFRLTNRVGYVCPIPDGTSLSLTGPGGTIPISDGTSIRFWNRDLYDCPGFPVLGGEVTDKQLPDLAAAVGLAITQGPTTQYNPVTYAESTMRDLPGGEICQPCVPYEVVL